MANGFRLKLEQRQLQRVRSQHGEYSLPTLPISWKRRAAKIEVRECVQEVENVKSMHGMNSLSVGFFSVTKKAILTYYVRFQPALEQSDSILRRERTYKGWIDLSYSVDLGLGQSFAMCPSLPQL
jgi:hypothetical protein